jgi:hypothetical protein
LASCASLVFEFKLPTCLLSGFSLDLDLRIHPTIATRLTRFAAEAVDLEPRFELQARHPVALLAFAFS